MGSNSYRLFGGSLSDTEVRLVFTRFSSSDTARHNPVRAVNDYLPLVSLTSSTLFATISLAT